MRIIAIAFGILFSAVLVAQPPTFQRGQIVLLTPEVRARAGGIRAVRVVAIAGDRIHIDAQSMLVNDALVEGLNPRFSNGMSREQPVLDSTVPVGQVLVVGELVERLPDGKTHEGRYWALTGVENVIATAP